MHTPSSKYLSRQPTILRGLSLNELFFVVLTGVAGGAMTGLISGAVIGFVAVFMILGILFGGLVGYFAFSKVLVRLKGSAPTWLLKKKVIIRLSQMGIIKNPYQHYEGVWLKSKKIKG